MQEHTSHTAFVLELNTLYQGKKPVLPEARCMFSYQWDVKTNTGQAQLVSINGSMLSITLYPEGIEGRLSFLSDMQATPYSIKGVNIVISKVYLQIDIERIIKEAAIVFGYDGAVIQSTKDFDTNMQQGN